MLKRGGNLASESCWDKQPQNGAQESWQNHQKAHPHPRPVQQQVGTRSAQGDHRWEPQGNRKRGRPHSAQRPEWGKGLCSTLVGGP